MDISNCVNRLPLEDRLEAANAIRVLFRNGLFESIVDDLTMEVLQMAEALAHSREVEMIERSAIRRSTLIELFAGLKQAATEQEQEN